MFRLELMFSISVEYMHLFECTDMLDKEVFSDFTYYSDLNCHRTDILEYVYEKPIIINVGFQ